MVFMFHLTKANYLQAQSQVYMKNYTYLFKKKQYFCYILASFLIASIFGLCPN